MIYINPHQVVISTHHWSFPRSQMVCRCPGCIAKATVVLSLGHVAHISPLPCSGTSHDRRSPVKVLLPLVWLTTAIRHPPPPCLLLHYHLAPPQHSRCQTVLTDVPGMRQQHSSQHHSTSTALYTSTFFSPGSVTS